ncbi:peroxin, partial [Ascosphaera atra]
MNKISETRERFTSERTARENLRRRFEQNQTDCTFTVLALLPTATEHILEDLPVEQITAELHQLKARRQSRLSQSEPGANTDAASSAGDQQAQGQGETQNQEGTSSESFVHASQAQSDAAAAERPAPAKKRTRVQIWNELKITSITRAFTMAYTLTLLMLLTRIQLNLLGRRSYLASVVSLATPHPASSGISLEDHDDDFKSVFSNDHELNRQYLTFSWWLLNRGYKDLMQRVRDAVEQVFGPINIREDISQERLSELAVEVRKRVEGATNEDRKEMRWLPYMLPPRDLEASVFTESGVANDPEFTSATTADILAAGTPLRALLDETSDLIDSPTFSHIASLLNNVAFTYFFDKRIAPI